MTLQIVGIGTAVPEHTMSQDESLDLAINIVCRDEREIRLLRTMYRRAGVQNRYTCVPHRIAYQWVPEEKPPSAGSVTPGPTTDERMKMFAEFAPPLGELAATRALEDSDIRASDITHLITVSCTGFDAPGVDIELIERLGLKPTVQRLNIGFMGCHGAINGLRAARGLVAADPSARVLMCAVELCGLHYRFQWDVERVLANALFADGAAAIVFCGGEPIADATCRVRDTGSCLIPESKEAMGWAVGDHGFELKLSAQVPELIREHLKPWLSAWLDSHGHSINSIGSWAIHPGGPRILRAAEESLELEDTATVVSREILGSHGNMSSPTVIFILERLLKADAPLPFVALGFGPGMVAEVALID